MYHCSVVTEILIIQQSVGDRKVDLFTPRNFGHLLDYIGVGRGVFWTHHSTRFCTTWGYHFISCFPSDTVRNRTLHPPFNLRLHSLMLLYVLQGIIL